MSDFPTGINSELQANQLFESLVGKDNANLPQIDLFDSTHSVPWDEDSEVLNPVEKLQVEDLVKTFQAISGGLAAELQKEYEANRITGAKYSDAFLALQQVAMESAVQFTLGKDQAFWGAAKTQADAIASNNQNEVVRLQAMLHRATYALTKLKLSTEDSAFGTSEYQRKNLLPAQLMLVNEQTEAQRAQTSDTRRDETRVSGLLGRQMDLYAQQKQSYIDDIKIKATKVFTDLWVTQKMQDPGVRPTAAFNTDRGDEENPTPDLPHNFNNMMLNLRDMTGAPPWEMP